MAIDAAVQECRSYLTANNKNEYRDGRWVYDADQIFLAEGEARSPLVLALTKDLAMYHLVKLCNVDFVYEKVQDAYDRAAAYLKRIAKGEVSPNLPRLEPDGREPFLSGSRKKFHHE